MPARALRYAASIAILMAACSEASDPDQPAPERWRTVKQQIRERFPDVPRLTVDEFARARRDDTLLIDARAPAEYAVSRIPGARNVPVDSAVTDALGDVPRDTPIVVYCSVGWRSSVVAERLQEAGFTDVRNLEGSIFEWANQGRPLENDAGPARVVHPYDADWGMLLRPELRADR